MLSDQVTRRGIFLKQQAVLAVDLDTIRIGGPKIITDPIL
jgi:hypothetical protein